MVIYFYFVGDVIDYEVLVDGVVGMVGEIMD